MSVRSSEDLLLLPQPALRLLREVRLADATGKIRGNQTMRLVLRRFAAEGLRPTRTEVGLTNGTPLMSVYWTCDDAGNEVGWQCQGNQWRLAMVLRTMSGRDPASVTARAAYPATQPGWFVFEPFYLVMGVPDVAARPARRRTSPDGFNKYDPDFVYRYRLLPPHTTVAQFVELAVIYGRPRPVCGSTPHHPRCVDVVQLIQRSVWRHRVRGASGRLSLRLTILANCSAVRRIC